MIRRAPLLTGLVLAVLVLAAAPGARAHTDTDLVAVPAGAEATLTLKPTHGCDGSPTVEVAIRAPMPGASAGAVSGWTATAVDDDQGNTVLEWTGGSLPADQTGEFPVTFTTPDTVGELLVFPAVQVCEDGTELAWIDGDPTGSYPAPRILVLAAGSEPAASIDDVPADAPGRDQLVAVIDVDNPSATTTPEATATTDPAAGEADEPETPTTTEPPATAEVTSAEEPTVDEEDDDGGVPWLLIGIVVVVGGAVAAYVVTRRPGSPTGDGTEG